MKEKLKEIDLKKKREIENIKREKDWIMNGIKPNDFDALVYVANENQSENIKEKILNQKKNGGTNR